MEPNKKQLFLSTLPQSPKPQTLNPPPKKGCLELSDLRSGEELPPCHSAILQAAATLGFGSTDESLFF